MSASTVLAYSYEAAYHCPQCAGNRFGTSWETGFVLESARDSEGNEIGAVAPWDEWFEPLVVTVQVLACDTCGKELDSYEPLDEIEVRAAEEGAEAGRIAGSWVTDGNTDAETYRRLLGGIRDGDPEILDSLPSAPFSGEYADGLLPRDFLADVGLTEEHDAADDVLRTYEDAYTEAAGAEVERACLAQQSTPDRAKEAASWFETADRPDGGSFVRLKGGAPEWVPDLVRLAHASMLPDDWRYATVREALDFIADSIREEDAEEEAGTFAQSTDDYTSDVLAWLGSHSSRTGYVDEAISDGLTSPSAGIISVIACGQYLERCEVYRLVLSALEEG
jgi:hypothetical protein